jgi:hypothetical protein
MSKRFQGKLCVYCSTTPSTTGDHVFSRKFFLGSERANLPKVPSCNACNHEKSLLEHYLTTVLPFGGRHGDARKLLQELVPSRLAKNVGLRRELQAGIGPVLSEELPGLRMVTTALPFDTRRLLQLCGFITKGLLWHQWAVMLKPHHDLRVLPLTNFGEVHFSRIFSSGGTKNNVTSDYGNGTFSCESAQGIDYPELSVWRFSIFGGLKLGGDPTLPMEESTSIGVITAEKQFLERPNQVAIYGRGH